MFRTIRSHLLGPIGGLILFSMVLAATIWLLGPLLAIGDVRPFDRPTNRLITIAGLAAVTIIAVLVILLRRRSQDRQMTNAIATNAAAPPAESDDSAVAAELSEVRKRMTEALGFLRRGDLRLKLTQQEGEAFLAEQIEGLANLALDLTGELGRFAFELPEQTFRVVGERVVETGDDLERIEFVRNRLVAQNLKEGAVATVHQVVVGNEWQDVPAQRPVAEQKREKVILVAGTGRFDGAVWDDGRDGCALERGAPDLRGRDLGVGRCRTAGQR